MKRFLAAALFLSTPALAAEQPAADKTEMVLLPRVVAETAAQWVRHPDAGNAVELYAALQNCLADNPRGGILRRIGADQCLPVSEAITARDKEIADLRKQVDDLKGAAPKSTKSHAGN